MNKIHILDSAIFNRIAAGEVVESPASVVKELVENAIDAGSTGVSIAIEGGGIDKIVVTDNGHGLDSEDLRLAFLPHATSKIKSLDDLNAILTLGFRGEALASIASVAFVTMTSKQKENNRGYFVSYQYGELTANGQVDAEEGTSVVVKGLFDKIPARKKFLKKFSIETAGITTLVKNLILANPKVSFRYIADGKHVYISDGAGLESAIYAVYGNLIEDLAPISHAMSGIKLLGYASLPENSKHNKTFQTLVVNNRVVENADISQAVYLAYKEYLMTRRYPVYVLHIDIPHDLVDVNVHPNKMLVKFVDSVSIRKIIYHALRKIVEIPTKQLWADAVYSRPSAIEEKNETKKSVVESAEYGSSLNNNYSASNFSNFATHNMAIPHLAEPSEELPQLSRKAVMESFFLQSNEKGMGDSEKVDSKISHAKADNRSYISIDYTIVGNFFNTYIVIQKDNNIFFIDQHAAHERILYDKFMATVNANNIEVQPLLIPYEFSLDIIDGEKVIDKISDINALGLGFDITVKNANIIADNRQNAAQNVHFVLSSVPAVLSSIRLNDFIETLLQDDLSNISNSTFLIEKIVQHACKAAIKAGDSLSENEIQCLLQQMLSQVTPPLCPHGRPTIIKLTKYDIEKWFFRK